MKSSRNIVQELFKNWFKKLVFLCVTFVKSFNSTFRVKNFLVSCVERVTFVADFNRYVLLSWTCFNFVSAYTFDGGLFVFRMNICFHFLPLSFRIPNLNCCVIFRLSVFYNAKFMKSRGGKCRYHFLKIKNTAKTMSAKPTR